MTKEEVQKALSGQYELMVITKSSVFHIHPELDGLNFGDSCLDFAWTQILYKDIRLIVRGYKTTLGSIRLGSDPEFFFKKYGRVVPSTQVIPEEGGEHVVRDGFQGELNPRADTCRQVAGEAIYEALEEAESYASRSKAEVCISVGEVVDDKTFLSVPSHERRFGCMPTLNPYENTKRSKGIRERFRAGAGHIHLGSRKLLELYEKEPIKVISLLDIACGLPCVLIDRDPANIKRREQYGRAGEHRVKPYGLEYRVPSNFWLKHYTLWSMVSGFARNGVNLAVAPFAQDIIDGMDMNAVRKAINDNDKELAMKLVKDYIKLLEKHEVVFDTGLSIVTAPAFMRWAETENPMKHLGVGDYDKNSINYSMETWLEHYEHGDTPGFEWYLEEEWS